jgi:hypothetical protein
MSELTDRLAAIADAAFDHDSGFERFGPSNFWMRFLVFLNDLSLYLLRRSIPGGHRAGKAITPLLRLYRELGIARPDILAFLKESAIELAHVGTLCPQPMPWSDESVPAQAMHIPNMLEPEAMHYYTWLGRTLEPAGEIVELGCWMGGSTACLCGGLRQNPRHRNLHVFDGFIWQDWMSRYATDPTLLARFRDGDCFIDAFLDYCAPFRDLLEVTQGRLPFDGDDGTLAPIRWHGEAIGAIIVDHSDRYEANVQAWEVFAQYFVPGETIVVFNQYGNLRAEELRRFCRDRKGELVLLHHLACSGRAFRFMGAS